MTYVRPGTERSSVGPAASSDSDYLAIDITVPDVGLAQYPEGAQVVATKAGYGIRYRAIGDSDGADNAVFQVEILDALPLAREAVQGLVGYDSDADKLSTATHEYTSIK